MRRRPTQAEINALTPNKRAIFNTLVREGFTQADALHFSTYNLVNNARLNRFRAHRAAGNNIHNAWEKSRPHPDPNNTYGNRGFKIGILRNVYSMPSRLIEQIIFNQENLSNARMNRFFSLMASGNWSVNRAWTQSRTGSSSPLHFRPRRGMSARTNRRARRALPVTTMRQERHHAGK